MLTNSDKKFWGRLEPVLEALNQRCQGATRVLDVGAGSPALAFKPATHVVDLIDHRIPGVSFHKVDFRADRLPFDDDEFDFVYCRHVVEDLDDPRHLCEEMQRVGRTGYIETPSPVIEMCRGVDGGSPPWRGYCHHRHFVWVHEGRLKILPKLPLVEHISTDESAIASIARSFPFQWNTYFLWDEKLDVDFEGEGLLAEWSAVQPGQSPSEIYLRRVLDAVQQGMNSSTRWMRDQGLLPTPSTAHAA